MTDDRAKDDAGVQYRVNARDEIVFVDEAWLRFADANDGAGLHIDSVLGRSLWDFISDQTTRDLYKQMVARVREGSIARFALRCDGPACKRTLSMVIRASGNDEIEFATAELEVVERAPVELFNAQAARSDTFIRACAWCNRIDIGNSNWVEVEEATERLGLFEGGASPRLTHGVCESCLETMNEMIDAMPAGAAS